MKDKELIEEMGKDVCENINTKMCANGTCPKIWDCPYSNTMAEILIEKGYRKIDKDSVVLSREELNDIENKCFDNGLDKGAEIGRANASKETAEKFYEFAKAWFEDDEQNDYFVEVKNLAKSLGVEIKE